MAIKLAINRTIVFRVIKVVCKVLINCWAVVTLIILFSIFIYWLLGGVIPLFLLAVLLTVILYNLEDYLLYHPELPSHSRIFVSVPSIFGLPYESVFTTTTDGTLLHLFVILQPNKSNQVPTIVYFHGNAGNVGHRLQNVAELYQQLQCNIVMVEYRGYGLSQGKPSESGLCMDGRAALDYVASRKDFNHREIILFGRSLGGAVAIDVAVDPLYSSKIWCLFVENSFTSIPDMANVLIGWRILKKLPLICYKNKFLSAKKAIHLAIPTMFLSGTADNLVPPRMMTELHEACGSTHKQLVQFTDGTHNETWHCRGYYAAIGSFLRDLRLKTTNHIPAPS